ncbi:MAG: hypothetical protein ACKO1J_06125 [Tagaea sp.]
MPARDSFILSQNGTLRRDTGAGPSSPFAAALKCLSEPKPAPAKLAPTPPARGA